MFKQFGMRLIPEDWKLKTVGETCNLLTGFPFSGNLYDENEGIRVLRGENVSIGFLRWDTIERWKYDTKGLEKYFLEKGDVVIGMDGSRVGKNRAQIQELDLPLLIAQRVARLRAKEDLDQDFLAIAILDKRFEKYVESVQTGTSIPHISGNQIKAFVLPIPPILEQRQIAWILSSINKKIELNQKTNVTLEAIGQAIFKHWFADFEFPNEEGKPYKSSGGEMINSELGEMPKNWEVKSVGDVLELAYGRALKETVRQAGSTPVYGSNGQIGWHNERLVKGPGIIVGRKGNPGTVLWSETDFFPIDTTFYVVPKDTAKSLYYLFYVLRNQGLALLSADSAVPGLNRNVVYMNPILVPTPTTLSQFDGIIQGLFYKVQNNNEQTAILSQIRDFLLPKLMSGKIRVPVPKENVEA